MFEVHRLNAGGFSRAEDLAQAFDDVEQRMSEAVGPIADGGRGVGGRELALARTKLQEACFWAKRAMALQVENQEVASHADGRSGA